MATIDRTAPLRPPKAPNLPISPVIYSTEFQEQFSNVLRLYFNQIDNGLSSLLSGTGGGSISFPHICASDSTDQYAGGNNTPTLVNWNTLDSGDGWTLNAPGSATSNVSGVFKITYSAQLINTDNAAHDATFWLKKNNVDVANSATVFTVPARKSAGVFSYTAAYSEITFSVIAGDEVELYWATDLAYNTVGPVNGVYIFHDVAQTVPYVRPAIPSVIGSITFISRLPTTA